MTVRPLQDNVALLAHSLSKQSSILEWFLSYHLAHIANLIVIFVCILFSPAWDQVRLQTSSDFESPAGLDSPTCAPRLLWERDTAVGLEGHRGTGGCHECPNASLQRRTCSSSGCVSSSIRTALAVHMSTAQHVICVQLKALALLDGWRIAGPMVSRLSQAECHQTLCRQQHHRRSANSPALWAACVPVQDAHVCNC